MAQHATHPQRTRIDWGAAKAFYVTLDTTERSFARVAREYRVTALTVRKHAHREGWVELAAKLDASGAAKALANAVRTIEERNARTVKLTEGLRDRAIEKLNEIDPNVAVRALPRYLPIEQLIAGEATSRIEIGDVNALVNAVFTVSARWVISELPVAERKAGFERDLDEALGGLVAEGGRS